MGEPVTAKMAAEIDAAWAELWVRLEAALPCRCDVGKDNHPHAIWCLARGQALVVATVREWLDTALHTVKTLRDWLDQPDCVGPHPVVGQELGTPPDLYRVLAVEGERPDGAAGERVGGFL